MPTVKFSIDESAVATVTLDRDDKRNAISDGMAGEILQCLQQAEKRHARVVIVRANPGVSVWCAGHDLRDLDPTSLDEENLTLEVCRKIQSSPLPVIAMVEGQVYAGGLLLLLSADIVVATETASVAIPANKIGLPLAPQWYALWLSVMGLHQAKELLLTAAPITAADACRAGLYNRLVPAEELEQTARDIAEQIVSCSPEGVANSKRALNLIAAQLALAKDEQAGIQKRNREILHSPEVKARIAALMDALRG